MDRQLLLAKKEVTYGVDPVGTSANTVWAEDVDFKITGQRVTPNPAKPGVGGVADHTYGEHVELTYKVPLAASGVAGTAPKFGPMLKASGWTETVVAATSVTYALRPDPVGADSLTIKWRDGNRRVHLVKGFRAAVSFELTAGQRPMLVFKGKGLHTIVTNAGADLAQADADFTGWLDARPVANGTTSFDLAGAASLGIRELSFEASDNVRFLDVPGQENVELVGDRTFSGRVKITVPPVATLNLETLWTAGTVVAFTMVHGAAAGKICTISGNTQLMDPVYARDNGDDVVTASLKLVPTTLTSDNDLVLVFT